MDCYNGQRVDRNNDEAVDLSIVRLYQSLNRRTNMHVYLSRFLFVVATV